MIIGLKFGFVCFVKDRNLTEEERKDYKEITWDSKEVCAYYMARFCPHDLFVNTKSDLGKFFLALFDQYGLDSAYSVCFKVLVYL